MNKKITNNYPNKNNSMSPKKRIVIGGGLIISTMSLSSIFIFGFSFFALFLLLFTLVSSSLIYIVHHIQSGAYLPQKTEKSNRQKLISLKFKLSSEFETVLDECISAEKKVHTHEDLLTHTIGKFFKPTEVTYQRYYNTGMTALNAIKQNIELIIKKLSTLQHLDNNKNTKKIIEQINANLTEIKILFQAYEELIMSFEACEISSSRDDILEQLKELAERTNKYMN